MNGQVGGRPDQFAFVQAAGMVCRPCERRCCKRPFDDPAGFWGKTFKHVQLREQEQPIMENQTIQVPKGTLETGRRAPPRGERIPWLTGSDEGPLVWGRFLEVAGF